MNTEHALPALGDWMGDHYKSSDESNVAGWLHSPEGAAQRRQSLMMVTEGSLVAPPTYPAGDVSDVRELMSLREAADHLRPLGSQRLER